MTNEDLHHELGKLVAGLSAMKREVSALRGSVEDVVTEVKSLTEFKNNGKGILLGVSLAAGGMGAAIKMGWDYLKGHIV